MSLLFEVLVAFLAVAIITITAYCKKKYRFWKLNGVPYLQPMVPFGNLHNLFTAKLSYGEVVSNRYKFAKSKGYKHVGLFAFTTPEYMPIELELLKNILIRDFNYFCDRGFYSNQEKDLLTGNLFSLGGKKWRKMRAKLTPTFTLGKIKMMFNIILECTRQLEQAVDNQCKQGPIDVKDFFARFGTDVVGSCAFGLNCNSFANSEHEFCKYTNKIVDPTVFKILVAMVGAFFPSFIEFFNLKFFSDDSSNFYLTTVKDAVEYRKKNNVVGNDFLQILINLMEEESGISIEDATAQAFAFFVAGFETTATAMTFCLLELVLNEEVQDKLRNEVNAYMKRHNQKMTYENLKELAYMRQVLKEVMRKYPPVPVLNRKCEMDYKVPKTDLVLKKGTLVTVSVLGMHNDPEYFPEPEKFDPERFAPKNKEKMRQLSYIPFGEGPRVCIGLRFAMLQMKIALTTLVKNYKFSLNKQTQLPLKMNRRSFVLSPIDSILVNVEKI